MCRRPRPSTTAGPLALHTIRASSRTARSLARSPAACRRRCRGRRRTTMADGAASGIPLLALSGRGSGESARAAGAEAEAVADARSRQVCGAPGERAGKSSVRLGRRSTPTPTTEKAQKKRQWPRQLRSKPRQQQRQQTKRRPRTMRPNWGGVGRRVARRRTRCSTDGSIAAAAAVSETAQWQQVLLSSCIRLLLLQERASEETRKLDATLWADTLTQLLTRALTCRSLMPPLARAKRRKSNPLVRTL